MNQKQLCLPAAVEHRFSQPMKWWGVDRQIHLIETPPTGGYWYQCNKAGPIPWLATRCYHSKNYEGVFVPSYIPDNTTELSTLRIFGVVSNMLSFLYNGSIQAVDQRRGFEEGISD